MTEFEKWYEEIKKNILGKGVNFGKILNHKNDFEQPQKAQQLLEAYQKKYRKKSSLEEQFLKKMQTQNWDYKKYLNLHLKEMNYK